jgi:prepilin-type N-terminal cleavage/methylation domain-containing protein
MKNCKGFTLLELIIVMAIFIGILLIASDAFVKILGMSSQQMKSAETQIEGIVGLEMLRYDLEHAGYGLPWSYPNSFAYTEVNPTPSDYLMQGVNSNSFNESVPPRAVIVRTSTTTSTIRSGSSNTNPGVACLVIKSVLAPVANKAVKRWSYINYSATTGGNASYIKQWGSADNAVQHYDVVITLNPNFDTVGNMSKQLVMNGTALANTYYAVGSSPAAAAGFQPPDPTQSYLVYTIDNQNSTTPTLNMPYNRADYYVKRPSSGMPSACNPGTGILYKAPVVHGSTTAPYPVQYPLLDCVGDMQVIYQLDMDGDGIPGTLSSSDGTRVSSTESVNSVPVTSTTGTLADAAALRQNLKQVQVYILAHEGGKDKSYTYPSDTIVVGDRIAQSLGRVWSKDDMKTAFGSDWRNYRWKVYTLMVRPKNLTN